MLEGAPPLIGSAFRQSVQKVRLAVNNVSWVAFRPDNAIVSARSFMGNILSESLLLTLRASRFAPLHC